ncbi:MAG: lipopolysaccharide heptosyltransferase II [Proteobacteria bacterium]|nr:lipopolysaccharide heptosyltransferase II [Pseudomonadota bacterium]
MTTAATKILVVGPSWVGDMVMSQSLYIYLQQSRPGVEIDVLAPAWSEPILARMPEVRRAIATPLMHGELGIGKRRKLGRELRGQQYQQAILLPNSLKSALIPFFSGVPQRTGWRGEMRYGLLNDIRKLDEEALPLMVQRFVALGQAPGEALPTEIPPPALVVDSVQAEACRTRFGLAPDKPILALCPGAEFGPAKCWPTSYYADIAQRYLDRGWQIALYGSANDKPVTGQILAQCKGNPLCFDLAGRTELAEAVDLLSLSTAVLSNDSGLMHIASALGCALLVIYGATSAGFTPPLSQNAQVIEPDIDCAPCFQRECPLGHHRCMKDSLPEQVAAKLDALLARIDSGVRD